MARAGFIRHVRQRAVAVLLALTPGPALAKPLAEQDVRALQQKLNKEEGGLALSFTQKVKKGLRKNRPPLVSRGKAYFAQPSKFRWILEHPAQEEFIYDGKTLYQYKPAENAVLKLGETTERSQEVNQLVSLVLNADQLLDHYTLRAAEAKPDGNVALALLPKKTAEVKSVDVTVNTKENFISHVQIEYQKSGTTEFDFAKLPKPKAGDPEVVFTPPPGIKVREFK